ncbi:hypothetical protein KUV44_06765 [Marinobacter daepoensis]|uniref:Lipoprotein n=1 Tax=Marinobacter daepoensis TaxID=262077 RepID=A0ABS3BGL3_9GAMM|nr:hypothetical protein [Marinobacter daepoensis]MBN7770970.1 hypothetical protein [Marinobacter daepoensis]MBY6078832.1 hypothetical protein [Marinobacter daepoensis]
MKRFSATALALLLCLSAAACASSSNLIKLEAPEPRTEAAVVTIARAGHPVRLPLESLANASFIGSDGEMILYAGNKSLFATVVTPEDWGNPSVQMNQAPDFIFRRDLSSIQDPEFRKELEGIISMTLEPAEEKENSLVTVGDITVYIAFSPTKTTIMLTSPRKPYLFTHLVLNNFSWPDIENEILKGIGGQ